MEEQGGMTPPTPPEGEPPSGPPPQTPPPQAPPPSGGGSSMGIDPGLAGLLCYLIIPLAGIIIYVVEKENKLIRFHALQSIFLGVAEIVIAILLSVVFSLVSAVSGGLGCVFGIMLPIYWLLVLVVNILMMVKGYQQEYYKLPVIGDMVEKQIGK